MSSLWISVSLTKACTAKLVIGKHGIQSLQQLKTVFCVLFCVFDRLAVLGAGVVCAFSTALTHGK